MWQTAFVAMSVAVGEPIDAVSAALGEADARVTTLLTTLRAESRQARALAIAQNLAPIAADIEAMEATWA